METTADNALPETLTPGCPACKRKLAPVPLMSVATLAVRRTCRGCKAKFSIVVRPMMVSHRKGIAAHEVNFTRL